MLKVLALAVMLAASAASAEITTTPLVVAPTDIFALKVEGPVIEVKILEGDTSSWVVPDETINQICDGTTVQINGTPIKDLIIKMDGNKVMVGTKTADYACPLSIEESDLREMFAAKVVDDYGWNEAELKAVLAAFDARHFAEVIVSVTVKDLITVDEKAGFDLYASPYGKRWTEQNLFTHIRDEMKDGKATLVRLDLTDRRIFIFVNDCGDIAKVSVGMKPVAKAATKRHGVAPAKPARQQTATQPAARHDPYRFDCGTCTN